MLSVLQFFFNSPPIIYLASCYWGRSCLPPAAAVSQAFNSCLCIPHSSIPLDGPPDLPAQYYSQYNTLLSLAEKDCTAPMQLSAVARNTPVRHTLDGRNDTKFVCTSNDHELRARHRPPGFDSVPESCRMRFRPKDLKIPRYLHGNQEGNVRTS